MKNNKAWHIFSSWCYWHWKETIEFLFSQSHSLDRLSSYSHRSTNAVGKTHTSRQVFSSFLERWIAAETRSSTAWCPLNGKVCSWLVLVVIVLLHIVSSTNFCYLFWAWLACFRIQSMIRRNMPINFQLRWDFCLRLINCGLYILVSPVWLLKLSCNWTNNQQVPNQ